MNTNLAKMLVTLDIEIGNISNAQLRELAKDKQKLETQTGDINTKIDIDTSGAKQKISDLLEDIKKLRENKLRFLNTTKYHEDALVDAFLNPNNGPEQYLESFQRYYNIISKFGDNLNKVQLHAIENFSTSETDKVLSKIQNVETAEFNIENTKKDAIAEAKNIKFDKNIRKELENNSKTYQKAMSKEMLTSLYDRFNINELNIDKDQKKKLKTKLKTILSDKAAINVLSNRNQKFANLSKDNVFNFKNSELQKYLRDLKTMKALYDNAKTVSDSLKSDFNIGVDLSKFKKISDADINKVINLYSEKQVDNLQGALIQAKNEINKYIDEVYLRHNPNVDPDDDKIYRLFKQKKEIGERQYTDFKNRRKAKDGSDSNLGSGGNNDGTGTGNGNGNGNGAESGDSVGSSNKDVNNVSNDSSVDSNSTSSISDKTISIEKGIDVYKQAFDRIKDKYAYLEKYAVDAETAFNELQKMVDKEKSGKSLNKDERKDFIGFYSRFDALSEKDIPEEIQKIYKKFNKFPENVDIDNNVSDMTFAQLEEVEKIKAEASSSASEVLHGFSSGDLSALSGQLTEIVNKLESLNEQLKAINDNSFDGLVGDVNNLCGNLDIMTKSLDNIFQKMFPESYNMPANDKRLETLSRYYRGSEENGIKGFKDTDAYGIWDANNSKDGKIEERALLLKNGVRIGDEIVDRREKGGVDIASAAKTYKGMFNEVFHTHAFNPNSDNLRFSETDIEEFFFNPIEGVKRQILACGDELLTMELPNGLSNDVMRDIGYKMKDIYRAVFFRYGAEIDKETGALSGFDSFSPEIQGNIVNDINFLVDRMLRNDYGGRLNFSSIIENGKNGENSFYQDNNINRLRPVDKNELDYLDYFIKYFKDFPSVDELVQLREQYGVYDPNKKSTTFKAPIEKKQEVQIIKQHDEDNSEEFIQAQSDLTYDVDEVRYAVDNKTAAFENERNIVSQVIDSEINKLEELRAKVEEVTNEINKIKNDDTVDSIKDNIENNIKDKIENTSENTDAKKDINTITHNDNNDVINDETILKQKDIPVDNSLSEEIRNEFSSTVSSIISDLETLGESIKNLSDKINVEASKIKDNVEDLEHDIEPLSSDEDNASTKPTKKRKRKSNSNSSSGSFGNDFDEDTKYTLENLEKAAKRDYSLIEQTKIRDYKTKNKGLLPVPIEPDEVYGATLLNQSMSSDDKHITKVFKDKDHNILTVKQDYKNKTIKNEENNTEEIVEGWRNSVSLITNYIDLEKEAVNVTKEIIKNQNKLEAERFKPESEQNKEVIEDLKSKIQTDHLYRKELDKIAELYAYENPSYSTDKYYNSVRNGIFSDKVKYETDHQSRKQKVKEDRINASKEAVKNKIDISSQMAKIINESRKYDDGDEYSKRAQELWSAILGKHKDSNNNFYKHEDLLDHEQIKDSAYKLGKDFGVFKSTKAVDKFTDNQIKKENDLNAKNIKDNVKELEFAMKDIINLPKTLGDLEKSLELPEVSSNNDLRDTAENLVEAIEKMFLEAYDVYEQFGRLDGINTFIDNNKDIIDDSKASNLRKLGVQIEGTDVFDALSRSKKAKKEENKEYTHIPLPPNVLQVLGYNWTKDNVYVTDEQAHRNEYGDVDRIRQTLKNNYGQKRTVDLSYDAKTNQWKESIKDVTNYVELEKEAIRVTKDLAKANYDYDYAQSAQDLVGNNEEVISAYWHRIADLEDKLIGIRNVASQIADMSNGKYSLDMFDENVLSGTYDYLQKVDVDYNQKMFGLDNKKASISLQSLKKNLAVTGQLEKIMLKSGSLGEEGNQIYSIADFIKKYINNDIGSDFLKDIKNIKNLPDELLDFDDEGKRIFKFKSLDDAYLASDKLKQRYDNAVIEQRDQKNAERESEKKVINEYNNLESSINSIFAKRKQIETLDSKINNKSIDKLSPEYKEKAQAKKQKLEADEKAELAKLLALSDSNTGDIDFEIIKSKVLEVAETIGEQKANAIIKLLDDLEISNFDKDSGLDKENLAKQGKLLKLQGLYDIGEFDSKQFSHEKQFAKYKEYFDNANVMNALTSKDNYKNVLKDINKHFDQNNSFELTPEQLLANFEAMTQAAKEFKAAMEAVKNDTDLADQMRIDDADKVIDKAKEKYDEQLSYLNFDGARDVKTNIESKIESLNEELRKGSITASAYTKEIEHLTGGLNHVTGSAENTEEAIVKMNHGLSKKELKNAKQSSVTDKNGNVIGAKLTYTDKNGVQHTRVYDEERKAIMETTKTTGQATTAVGGFFDQLRGKWGEVLRYFLSFGSLYEVWDILKQGGAIIKELDDALTEMNKVSDEPLSKLQQYQKESFSIASEIGTTGAQIQQSTADFLRLGEDFNQAKESAKAANVLFNVSEFESIDEATESLIAMSSAYKDLDKMEINDKLNNVGNNYSIATDGLASALQKSASALQTSGVDIDKAIALITAGNAVVQDPDSVGAGIRTIALRMAGTKAAKSELESIGEDTSDFIIKTKSKIDEQLRGFTAVEKNNFKGVSMLDENGNLRDTYSVLQDIADIYDDIIATDKKMGTNHLNGLLELLAGKNRSNIAASILQNGDMLRDVYESSKFDSEGSAMKENQKYLDSISGHLDVLQNKWQEVWQGTAGRDMINPIIDAGTAILNLVDNVGLLQTAAAGGGLLYTIKQIFAGGFGADLFG